MLRQFLHSIKRRIILPLAMRVHIGLQEQQKDSSIQNRIEEPSSNPITPSSHEMQQKHPNVTNQVKTQQQNLAIHGERKALAYGQPNFRPEPVPIHQ